MAEFVIFDGVLLRRLHADQPFVDLWSEARRQWNVWTEPPDWDAGRPVSAEEAAAEFPNAVLDAETVTPDSPMPTWAPGLDSGF